MVDVRSPMMAVSAHVGSAVLASRIQCGRELESTLERRFLYYAMFNSARGVQLPYYEAAMHVREEQRFLESARVISDKYPTRLNLEADPVGTVCITLV